MINKKALLVVSFGTSYDDTLEKTILACEKRLSKEFPDYNLKRSFTSHMIIRKLKRLKGEEIDTPVMALERLLLAGYTDVILQPLHIIPGSEYNEKILEPVLPFKQRLASLKIGKPLLYHIDDYKEVLSAIREDIPSMAEDEALVLMGHGSSHSANSSYSCLQSIIDDEKLPYHIACVEGYPYLERVFGRLAGTSVRKIHLIPLMLVAGDHARNDMASEEEDSWKSRLEKEGYEVECHLKGLGENIAIQNLFVTKAKSAKNT